MEADPDFMDMDDDGFDDAELQAALLMSMEESGPPHNANAQPQQPVHATAATQQPQQVLSALQTSQQALLAQLGGLMEQQLVAQQQQQLQAGPAPAPPVASGRSMPVPTPWLHERATANSMLGPRWLGSSSRWIVEGPDPSARPPCSIPSGGETALASAFREALGVGITLLRDGNVLPSGESSGASVMLNLMQAPGGNDLELRDSALSTAVRYRLQRPHLLPGSSKFAAMGDCFSRAAAAAGRQTVPGVQMALSRLGEQFASAALDVLAADDGEDLFFEGGQATQGLFAAILAGHVRQDFLEAMMAQTRTEERGKVWMRLLQRATSAVKETALTELPASWQSRLHVVSVLMSLRPLQQCLASVLLDEAWKAAPLTGPQFEKASQLTPLLTVTAMPDFLASLHQNQLLSPARENFMQLRGYPNRPGDTESAQRSLALIFQMVSKATHGICDRIVRLKGVDPSGMPREAVVAWLAAAAGTGESRAAEGEKGVLKQSAVKKGCSDGFAVATTALALQFCRPFLGGEDKFLQRLDPEYYQQAAYRIPGNLSEQTLAGRPTSDVLPLLRHNYVVEDLSKAPHFVADCFFITQRLFRTALIPAVNRYHEALETMMARHRRSDEDKSQQMPVDVYLMSDCTFSQLMDPDFAADAVRFVSLEALWLLRVMRLPEAEARRAFSLIPESVVKDMATWLSFVIQAGHADQVAGVPLQPLMDCLIGMLQRPDLVRSPLVHNKIVALLQAMLAPHLDPRRQRAGAALGPSHMRPGERALLATVLGTGSAQQDLVPALMRVYAAADHVVGLDVDRDKFDKFGFRYNIDNLLMSLWQDAGCFASTTRMAEEAQRSGSNEVFSDYVGAVLNSLMYLLQDSLDRLQSIYDLEQSKKDEAAWNAVPDAERQAKEQFAASQGHVTQGFMRMAVAALAVLNRLSSDPNIKQAFLKEPLTARAAFASTTFINTLVGPRVAGLQVEKPSQYNFHPNHLLLSMLEFTLRLAEAASFCGALAAEADYSEEVMRAAHARLLDEKLGEYGVAARLETLIGQVNALRASPSAGGDMKATASGGAVDLALPYPESTQLAADYCSQLQDLLIDGFDSSLPGSYSSVYSKVSQESGGDVKKKMRRLNAELKQLSKGDNSIPLSPAAAIFIRYDADRPDKMRAMFTGPEDTPYFGGCFIFDIYFPPEYPDVPPLMTLETTGAGRARFNPNLYADGKVCLSLLGTWHGTNESEKWHPDTANLWRILISIQGMILIADPYFNEPAYEGVRGTAEGDRLSQRYNLDLVLHTIRFAINDKLRNPPPGFEEVIRRHFKLQAHRILRACAGWQEKAKQLDMEPQYQRRLGEEIDKLHSLLAGL